MKGLYSVLAAVLGVCSMPLRLACVSPWSVFLPRGLVRGLEAVAYFKPHALFLWEKRSLCGPEACVPALFITA